MISKIDLSDTTFVMVIRLDSIERLENILAVCKYISSHFQTSMIVLETNSFYNGLLKSLLPKTIKYIFEEDDDPILYRTKFLNRVSCTVETPITAVWDSDIIAPIIQIEKALLYLRNNEADFIYPYEKLFLDTTKVLRKIYLQEESIEFLVANINKMKELYSPNPLGGAFFGKTNSYKESGMENENFYGWGLEDGERYYRWKNLGYRILRVNGPIFHLTHSRGINSSFHNIDQKLNKQKEMSSIIANLKDIR